MVHLLDPLLGHKVISNLGRQRARYCLKIWIFNWIQELVWILILFLSKSHVPISLFSYFSHKASKASRDEGDGGNHKDTLERDPGPGHKSSAIPRVLSIHMHSI